MRIILWNLAMSLHGLAVIYYSFILKFILACKSPFWESWHSGRIKFLNIHLNDHSLDLDERSVNFGEFAVLHVDINFNRQKWYYDNNALIIFMTQQLYSYITVYAWWLTRCTLI